MKTSNATVEQWRILVALSEKMKAMKPWEQFEDMEIFALSLPQEEELVYASVMGFHGMCYGLSFYRGEEGLIDLSTVAYEIENKSFCDYVTMNLNFYSVYFDDQQNVSYLQQEIYQKLGLDKSEYPHFTVKEYACFPDDPDCEEVEKYTLYMAALIEALEYYFKNDLQIDFNENMFVYDVEQKSGGSLDVVYEPRTFEPILPSDTDYLDTLMKTIENHEEWEVDYNYTNQGFEREDGRVSNLRLSLVASRTSELMLNCLLLKEDDDENEVVLDSFLQLIEKLGRPKCILVKNIRLFPLLGPTCDRLHIEIKLCEQFVLIDEFLEAFFAYANEKELAS